MNVFLDTSALFALLDQDDDNHERAARAWKQLIENGARLITSNYILFETVALLQSRLGMDAVRVFQTKMLPPVHIEYVSADFRRLGMASLLPAGKRKLSLVDCAGFEIMRQMGLMFFLLVRIFEARDSIRCHKWGQNLCEPLKASKKCVSSTIKTHKVIPVP